MLAVSIDDLRASPDRRDGSYRSQNNRSRLGSICVLLIVCAMGCGSSPPHQGRPKHHAATGRVQIGYATWYGPGLHGRPTASGELFDRHALTAAHRTLRLGTRVRVTNRNNGRSVIVRINDRGPFGNKNRIIDLSEHAAQILGIIKAGVAPVKIEVLR